MKPLNEKEGVKSNGDLLASARRENQRLNRTIGILIAAKLVTRAQVEAAEELAKGNK